MSDAERQAMLAREGDAAQKRPDGTSLVFGSYVLIGVGICAFLLGAAAEEVTADIVTGVQASNPSRGVLLWGGASLCIIGALIWAVGSIQRAIWFLPGRND